MKVLVVEDEEMIRKGIVLAVDWAALDCVVVGEAADGLQALKAVERYDPSLIITDLKMPNMDGIQMMEALRARTPFPLSAAVKSSHFSPATATRQILRHRGARTGSASAAPRRQ